MQMLRLSKNWNDFAWSGWLLIYAVLTIGQHFIINWSHGAEVYFFNGGVLLVALLDISRRGARGSFLAVFLILILALDCLIKTKLVGLDVMSAMLTSSTIILQGYMGFLLLKIFNLSFELPNTPKRVMLFTWFSAFLPVLVSSLILVLSSKLLITESEGEGIFGDLIWWFVSRLTSVILVAPVILLGLRHTAIYCQSDKPFFEKEFWWLLCGTLTFTYIIFTNTPPEVATYSYLLLPILLYCAVRLPLFQSLLIVLLVCIVCFWVNSEDYQTSKLARENFLALSAFLLINGGVVLLVGALVGERSISLNREKKQKALYEMLSRVNQAVVKDNLDRESLCIRVCNIILEESCFNKVCIVPYPSSNLSVDQIDIELNELQCRLIDESENKRHAVFFSSCEVCEEFGSCKIKPLKNGSKAVFPIYQDENITAALVVYGNSIDIFDEDHFRLFQEMANDIGFAINMYEHRLQFKQVDEVFQHSRESIIITDKEGKILNVNPSFMRISGYSRDEVLGNNPRILNSGRQDNTFYKKLFDQLNSEGYWSGQFWNKRKNGELYLQRGTISAVMDNKGQPAHFIAVMEDASAQNDAEQKIHSLANYDQLTGLPNRGLLSDRFSHAFADARRHGQVWCLMFIDLDDFKQVNDALGHHIGDALLNEVSQRLKTHIRETDTLCRFGGDEFILLMSGDANEAAELANRLVNQVSMPYEFQELSLQIGASIGISVLFQDGENLEELIQASDTAMYQAKAEGRGCYRFFAKSMQSKVQSRLALKHALKKAITENELCLFYQLKVALTTDGKYEAVGYEALVRWNDPLKGLVSPANFIPAAEESGQIVDIDRWVLKNVIDQIEIWLKQKTIKILPVAINLSATLFSKAGFVDELSMLLSLSGVPAYLIELEITEHVATHDISKALATLNALKKVGVGLAIDDFGTGYSSLSYLQQFPIDYLKIDMSFVRNVHDDPKKQGLVKAIITMAHALGLKTIAEGVEVVEEVSFLNQNGCNQYQGYYFGKPVPADQL